MLSLSLRSEVKLTAWAVTLPVNVAPLAETLPLIEISPLPVACPFSLILNPPTFKLLVVMPPPLIVVVVLPLLGIVIMFAESVSASRVP